MDDYRWRVQPRAAYRVFRLAHKGERQKFHVVVTNANDHI